MRTALLFMTLACLVTQGSCRPAEPGKPDTTDASDAGQATPSDGGPATPSDAGPATPDAGHDAGADSGTALPDAGSMAEDDAGPAAGDAGTVSVDAGLGDALEALRALPGSCSVDGWCWRSPTPHGNDYIRVFSTSGDNIWLTGQHGTVWQWTRGEW